MNSQGMDGEMETSERAAQLDHQLQDIRKVVLFIKEIQSEQPSTALSNARRAAEALCKGVLAKYDIALRKTNLDSLIAAVAKLEEVPEVIVTSLRTIQHFGNLGAHHRYGGEVNEFDISPCLQSLANVINWYCEKLYNVNFKSSDLIDANKKLKRLELEKKNRLERLSFCLSLDNEDTKIIDLYHDYIKIKRFDVLNSSLKNYTSHRWLQLKNISQTDTTYIQHQESGENKISFEQLNVRAFNETRTGTNLAVENLVTHQPSFVQKIKIYLPQCLKPGGICDIYYRISWPGELLSYSGNIHSQSISFTRYAGQVGQLVFGVFDQTKLSPVKCVGVHRDYSEVVLNVSPSFLRADDVPEFAPIHGKGYAGFYYTLEPGNLIAIRLYYYTVVQNSEGEEEF